MAATRGVTAPMGRRTLLLVSALLIAALGSTMVYLYAQSADARAREGLALKSVLVAQVDVPAGTPVSDAAVWFDREELNAEAVADGALGSVQGREDQVTLVPIYAGEQLLAEKVGDSGQTSGRVPLTEGNIAVTIALGDPERVANFVTPGSTVAIFLTGPDAEGAQTTRLLLGDVKVAGVGDTTSTGDTPQGPTALLTLDVSQPDAQKIILAQTQGRLYLARTDGASTVEAGQPTRPRDLLG
jgi:pilus assembly protein CpaB